MIEYDFFHKVEKTHNYVKYSDTDSLFLNIPQIKTDNIQELIKNADKISEIINKAITKVMTEYVLPKMNVSSKYNFTDFKNELVIGRLLLLDVKKNYAYLLIAKEGNIVDPPKVKYTGIPVIRNDFSKFTQVFLDHMIRSIILSGEYKTKKEMIKAINQFAIEMKNRLDKDIEEFEFDFIGIPCKWGGREYESDTTVITGMKLYNTIMDENIFGPLTSGRRVIIKIRKNDALVNKINVVNDNGVNYLSKDVDIKSITSIVIPYKYDKDKLRSRFEEYMIKIDREAMWNTLFSTTCRRIVAILKE